MKAQLHLQLLTILLLFITITSHAHSEVLWEKELHSTKFIQTIEYDLAVSDKLYEYNGSYFILYFGMDSSKAEKVKEKWKGNKYPALLKFDNNGNTIYQNEKAIPMIDSLVKAGVTISQHVRGNRINNDFLFFDIPQVSGADKTPNIYSFSPEDGNLNSIEGTMAMNFQLQQLFKSIFTDNEIYVLAIGLFNFNQSRIDVHNQTGDEYGRTLKYRITLEMDSFKDSMPDETFAYDFLMADDNSFIVTFPGKDQKTIMAKYSYNKEEASNLPTGGIITADLDWFTIYKPVLNSGFNQFQWLNNGNLLVHSGFGSITIFNNTGELIFNKKVFNDTFNNYTINNFMPLKYHPGYYAFWGYYIDNKEQDFAVLITDSDWNVVDAILWDYNGKSNSVTDIKETEDGNLIVWGNSLYKEITESGTLFSYIPYYAELKPNYVSVKEQADELNLGVSPNPAGDFITVDLKPSEGFEPSEGSEINIYNKLGEKVMSETIHPMTASQRMNIESLPKGVYFVKVGGETAKFVKM